MDVEYEYGIVVSQMHSESETHEYYDDAWQILLSEWEKRKKKKQIYFAVPMNHVRGAFLCELRHGALCALKFDVKGSP